MRGERALGGSPRRARDERTRRIVALALYGRSTEEIAKGERIGRSTVRDGLARLGIDAGPPGTHRAPSAFVPLAVRDAINALAAERGEPACDVSRALLTVAFEEGAFHARRLLRNKAKA